MSGVTPTQQTLTSSLPPATKVELPVDDDLDGQPMQLNLLSSSYDSDKEDDDDDVDGVPLDPNNMKKRMEGKAQQRTGIGGGGEDDIDGAPLTANTNNNPSNMTTTTAEGTGVGQVAPQQPAQQQQGGEDDIDGTPLS